MAAKPMPVAVREAKRLIGAGVARAYGWRRPDDHQDVCARCEGDGCVWCHHTGMKQSVRP